MCNNFLHCTYTQIVCRTARPFDSTTMRTTIDLNWTERNVHSGNWSELWSHECPCICLKWISTKTTIVNDNSDDDSNNTIRFLSTSFMVRSRTSTYLWLRDICRLQIQKGMRECVCTGGNKEDEPFLIWATSNETTVYVVPFKFHSCILFSLKKDEDCDE